VTSHQCPIPSSSLSSLRSLRFNCFFWTAARRRACLDAQTAANRQTRRWTRTSPAAVQPRLPRQLGRRGHCTATRFVAKRERWAEGPSPAASSDSRHPAARPVIPRPRDAHPRKRGLCSDPQSRRISRSPNPRPLTLPRLRSLLPPMAESGISPLKCGKSRSPRRFPGKATNRGWDQ
jgi:hypothetical protein